MRNAADAKRNPIAGDEFQYSWRGLIYWRKVRRLTFDLRKRTVVMYEVTNLENDTWMGECLLTSWRRWSKRLGVTVERIQQESPDA